MADHVNRQGHRRSVSKPESKLSQLHQLVESSFSKRNHICGSPQEEYEVRVLEELRDEQIKASGVLPHHGDAAKCIAAFDQESKLFYFVRVKGNYHQSLGFFLNGRQMLYAEEAMFLFAQGMLEIQLDADVEPITSMRTMYRFLYAHDPFGMLFERIQLFAYLRFPGYAISIRSPWPPVRYEARRDGAVAHVILFPQNVSVGDAIASVAVSQAQTTWFARVVGSTVQMYDVCPCNILEQSTGGALAKLTE